MTVSLCPSVCPSEVKVLSKRLNCRSCCFVTLYSEIFTIISTKGDQLDGFIYLVACHGYIFAMILYVFFLFLWQINSLSLSCKTTPQRDFSITTSHQLAIFQLTQRVARSICGSWASCTNKLGRLSGCWCLSILYDVVVTACLLMCDTMKQDRVYHSSGQRWVFRS